MIDYVRLTERFYIIIIDIRLIYLFFFFRAQIVFDFIEKGEETFRAPLKFFMTMMEKGVFCSIIHDQIRL